MIDVMQVRWVKIGCAWAPCGIVMRVLNETVSG